MELDIKGTRFEYFEKGDGEPMVLVHGSASDYRTWQSQADVFARKYRVIYYSRRYHWPNEEIPRSTDYSMEQHLEDLQGLLKSIEAGPVHLVGHSYGAFLCLLLAIREPGLVKSLVLAEPPVVTLFVSNEPKPLEILRLLVTRPRTALSVIKFGAMGVAPATRAFIAGDMDKGVRIFGDTVFGSGGFQQLSESGKKQVKDNITNIRAELLGTGLLPLKAKDVREVKVSTLLVRGDQTISLFRNLTERLHELLPRSEMVEISGARHSMHEDNPEAYNNAILSFLAKHK